jgi:hypothetical protein
MKKIIAAMFCITLMGMPVLSQSCCPDKQKTQAQTQQKQCSKQKSSQCKKGATAQKDSCKGKDQSKCSEQARKECLKNANTWMTSPAKCKKKECQTAAR